MTRSDCCKQLPLFFALVDIAVVYSGRVVGAVDVTPDFDTGARIAEADCEKVTIEAE